MYFGVLLPSAGFEMSFSHVFLINFTTLFSVCLTRVALNELSYLSACPSSRRQADTLTSHRELRSVFRLPFQGMFLYYDSRISILTQSPDEYGIKNSIKIYYNTNPYICTKCPRKDKFTSSPPSSLSSSHSRHPNLHQTTSCSSSTW